MGQQDVSCDMAFLKVLLCIISITSGLNMLLVEGSTSKCGKCHCRGFPLKVVVLVLTSYLNL